MSDPYSEDNRFGEGFVCGLIFGIIVYFIIMLVVTP
jgi:hypothetical protein